MSDDTPNPAEQPVTGHDEQEPTEAYRMLVGAGKLWAEACGYFGDPREMFRHPFMRARQRRIVADWVRCLEMLVRRIILMVALKLELTPQGRTNTQQGARNDALPVPANKVVGPFKALRPTLIIMPAIRRGHRRLVHTTNPIEQLRLHTLARRLIAINDAIINAHLYARRTAFSLAQIAERHRNKPHPLIALSPWLIREEKRTSGQAVMHDQIEHAQAMCNDQLDLWHGRILVPG